MVIFPPLFLHLPALVSLAAPLILSAMLQQAAQITTFLFVGRLDSTAMGAYALGNMLCNVTGYTLVYGMCTGLDTLIAQAFGAKHFHLMGLHAQRAILIISLCMIPVLVIWFQTAYILQHGLLINEGVAVMAGRWARLTSLGLWPTIIFEIMRRFLQVSSLLIVKFD